ncbi:MAG: HAMP domain-containing histidine kinase [Desulfobacteraceae bacterium]|nr:HAMP domain-containing histidine kinase [Desulfobacteraceae bacterium]
MRLSLFKRLTFGYTAILLLLIFLGGYVTLQLQELNRHSLSITEIDSTTVRLAENITDTLITQESFEKKYLISRDPDFHRHFWNIGDYIEKDLKRLDPLLSAPSQAALLAAISASYARYQTLFRKEHEFIKNGRSYAYTTFQTSKERALEGIHQNIKKIITAARASRDRKLADSHRITTHITNVTALTAVLAIIAGVLVSFFTTRSITRPLLRLQEQVRAIAGGRFEMIPDTAGPPEIKALADDFNVMCRRLLELDSLKADFINQVSHDLRTPLTAIREASSMLIEGVYAHQPSRQQELLGIVREECERLILSVSRILDLSCMEANMLGYKFQPADLAGVVRDTVTKLAPIAQRKGIGIVLAPSENLPAVRMDVERIGQVLENLIGNALNYTDSGGVSISVSRDGTDQDELEVAVRDTGCGISTADLDSIFNKFKRIERRGTAPRGSGLGLSLAKHIIVAHGGRIWAESEIGTGSTFFFTLPI